VGCPANFIQTPLFPGWSNIVHSSDFSMVFYLVFLILPPFSLFPTVISSLRHSTQFLICEVFLIFA
jgi:hypothetical protein